LFSSTQFVLISYSSPRKLIHVLMSVFRWRGQILWDLYSPLLAGWELTLALAIAVYWLPTLTRTTSFWQCQSWAVEMALFSNIPSHHLSLTFAHFTVQRRISFEGTFGSSLIITLCVFSIIPYFYYFFSTWCQEYNKATGEIPQLLLAVVFVLPAFGLLCLLKFLSWQHKSCVFLWSFQDFTCSFQFMAVSREGSVLW
jgi:hypothetical protein